MVPAAFSSISGPFGHCACLAATARRVFLLWLGLSTVGVSAIDTSRKPSQLVHFQWARSEGLPAQATWAVTESQDGYLWIGTEGGLARFDGIKFTVFNSQTDDAFRADDVRSVIEDAKGALWLATYGGGILKRENHVFTRYDTSNGLLNDVVYSVLATKTGDVWAGTATGVCRLREEAFTCWTPKDGLASGRVLRMAQDDQGRIWFGTMGGGVSYFDGDSFTTYGLDDGLGSLQVFLLMEDPRLNIVIGTYSGDFFYAGRDGLVKMDAPDLPSSVIPLSGLRDRHDNLWIGANGSDGLWRVLPNVQRLDGVEMDVTHIFGLTEGRDGGLWAATSHGIHHYRAGPFSTWGKPEGIGDNSFVVLADQDSDGVWVGTEGTGVYHVKNSGQFTQFTTSDGLPADSVSSLEYDADGVLWIGTFGGGLARLKEGEVVSAQEGQATLPDAQVSAIYRDRANAMWVGTGNGLVRMIDHAVTHRFTVDDGLPANLVRHLTEDRRGHLLVSTDSGLARLSLERMEIIDTFDRQRGLVTNVVATSYVDRNGTIWIGHRAGGLARLDGDELFRYEREHELGIDSIMTIIEDFEGYLWLAGRRGIVRVAKSDLEDVANDRASRVSSRSFNENDGLRTVRVPGGYKSASTRTRDGRIWFATDRGVAVVDPRTLPSSSDPLDIVIEDVLADGVSIARAEPWTIPAGSQNVQIEYTVPRLHDAESLTFRYRLNGSERWQHAGSRRTAFFTQIPVHDNEFEVAVTRKGQPFDAAGNGARSITLYVEPLWHQTRAMQLAKYLLIALLSWGLYRFAVRRYRYRQKRLQVLVNDRTEALREALGKVEKLSRTDALTQVSNRRHFEERLRQLWTDAEARSMPISVMMIDIDYFKQYNDVAGHQAGDDCLSTVAATLAGKVRGNDFVARYGGEEFAVILSGSSGDAAQAVGARLQRSVRELKLPHPGRPAGAVVTVSAGFATAEEVGNTSPEALLKLADEALYRAKERGRDCIVINDWARSA